MLVAPSGAEMALLSARRKSHRAKMPGKKHSMGYNVRLFLDTLSIGPLFSYI